MVMTGRTLQIPQNRLDNPVGGDSFEWGIGDYDGMIVDVVENDREPVAGNGELFSGYTSPDADRISIHFGQMQPLDDQPEPGERRVFLDLTLRDGQREIFDLTPEDFEDNVDYWQLRNSAVMLGKIAAAMGEQLNDEFVEDLRSGAYNRTSNAQMTVTLRTVNTKSGDKKPIVTDIN